MTPRLQDFNDFQIFYARMYEAFSGWEQYRYSAVKARIGEKQEAVGQKLQLPLPDIFLTTTNMDMKLVQIDRVICTLSDDTKIAGFR